MNSHATTVLSDIILYQRNDKPPITNWTVHYYSCFGSVRIVFRSIYCWNLWKTHKGFKSCSAVTCVISETMFVLLWSVCQQCSL